MNPGQWIRRLHRWLGIALTLAIVANFAAIGIGEPPTWLLYSPLPPLFALMFSGVYLFVLPYASGWPGGRRTRARE